MVNLCVHCRYVTIFLSLIHVALKLIHWVWKNIDCTVSPSHICSPIVFLKFEQSKRIFVALVVVLTKECRGVQF